MTVEYSRSEEYGKEGNLTQQKTRLRRESRTATRVVTSPEVILTLCSRSSPLLSRILKSLFSPTATAFSSPETLGLICNRPSFPYHVTKKRRALGTRMTATAKIGPDRLTQTLSRLCKLRPDFSRNADWLLEQCHKI